MLFNLIGKVLSYAHGKEKTEKELSYEMGGEVLKVNEKARNLGVIMHRSAKPSRHCAEASKRLIQL